MIRIIDTSKDLNRSVICSSMFTVIIKMFDREAMEENRRAKAAKEEQDEVRWLA